MTPRPIARLLSDDRFALMSAALLTLPFWSSGIAKMFDLPAALAEARHFGLEPAILIVLLTIVVQIGGSLLLIGGRWSWLGAGALGVFTAIATLIAHPFWSVADPMARFHQRNIFLEHVAIIGGLMVAAILRERTK